MDPLLEDYLADKITDDQFNEALGKLTPEEQSKLQEQAKSQKASDFESLKAIRKEKNRVQELADTEAARLAATQQAPRSEGGNYGETFRNEQVEVAKLRFFDKFGIPEADRAGYESKFKDFDSGKVSADLIYADFVKVYANENASTLIDKAQKFDTFEKDADEFNLDNAAGGGSSGGGSGGETKYPAAAYTLVANARKEGRALTLEEATRYLRKGGERTLA